MAIRTAMDEDYSMSITLLNQALSYADEEQKSICEINVARAYYNLGLIQLSNKNYKDADESFGKAISYGMATEETYVYKGYALLFSSKYYEAVRHFEAVANYNPNNIHARYLLSIALVYYVSELRDDKQVSEWLKKNQIQGLTPLSGSYGAICSTQYYQFLTNYPSQPMSLGDLKQAQIAVASYGASNQSTSNCSNGRQYSKHFLLPTNADDVVFTTQDFLAAKMPLIRENNDFELPDSASYVQRGKAFTNALKHEDAIKDFTTALDMDPENAEALLNRADVYKAMGNKIHEVRDLQEFLALNKDETDERVVLVKKRLEALMVELGNVQLHLDADNQEEQQ